MWYSPENFFEAESVATSAFAPLFLGLTHVWEALDRLEPFIRETVRGNVAEMRGQGDLMLVAHGLHEGRIYPQVTYKLGDPAKGELQVFHQGRPLPGAALVMAGAVLCDDDIEIGPGAVVESGALIKGPTIIGPGSEVRQGAYVRGGVMSSPGSIIGHTTEAKNVLLMPGAKAGHFAYLGDSILGHQVNLGAGTKLANLKMNDRPHLFCFEGQNFSVPRRKFGAIIGDFGETGCNTVTNPGTLLGRGAKVLPNTTLAPGYRLGHTFLRR